MTQQISSAPVLYSFRRCPYAMRARMAIFYSGVQVELREIVLRNKPEEMLSCSPKGTVPVLVSGTDEVFDESLEIMHWALNKNDPDDWLQKDNIDSEPLIAENDSQFKYFLDRYKYSDRYPEFSQAHYRGQGELFLAQLNQHLEQHTYLMNNQLTLADIAIAPFIRQFAHVDKTWFDQCQYSAVRLWLNRILESDLFTGCMKKYTPWKPEDQPVIFPI